MRCAAARVRRLRADDARHQRSRNKAAMPASLVRAYAINVRVARAPPRRAPPPSPAGDYKAQISPIGFRFHFAAAARERLFEMYAAA